jgi:hypothetical protein
MIATWMEKPDGDILIAGEPWYKVDDADGMFSAYFPGDKPKYEKHGFDPTILVGKKKDLELSFSAQTWVRKHDGRQYGIGVMTLPGETTGDAAERVVSNSPFPPPGRGAEVLLDDRIPIGGRQAHRIVTRAGSRAQVAAFVGVGSRQCVGLFVTGEFKDQNDPKVQAFFENFQLKK